MKAPFLFLSLLAVPPYVYCSVQLLESGSGTVNPGGSLRLTCTVTGDSVKNNFWEWVRQAPGKGLEWMGQIDWVSSNWRLYYNPSLQGRITLTADSSSNTYDLELRSVTAADTAVYYCARYYYSGSYFDYWGSGTMVTVTQASPAAPTLFPLIAPLGSEGNEKVAIGCMAKNFLPDSVTFSWNNKNNVSLSAITTKTFPSLLNSIGTYTASSQALVPSADWKKFDPFYCIAEHPAGSGKQAKRVIRSSGDTHVEPTTPEMIVRAPPIQAFFGSYLNATITCSVVNLPSNKYTLQWLKKGQVIVSGFTTTEPKREGHGYSIKSELIVTKRDWLSDISFSCAVNGKDFNETLKISKHSFCQGSMDNCNLDVHVETIPPSYADIFQTKSAKLTCRISNVPLEQDLSALNVTWTKESDKTLLKTVLGQPEDQANGLAYIDATATVCATEWDSHEAFTCKVNFPGLLPEPIDKPLEKIKSGTKHSPAVYVLPPTSDELALREAATLTCLVKGFYPEDIFVRWLHNDQPVNPANFYTSEPKEEPKMQGKFFTYSTLAISESDWSHGDTYTCVVGHEALPMNSTQKTVDKNTGKPTVVNVSLVLSDTATTCN